VVWINCTNLFDAASGFGGYRESGFGREGGREGLAEYLVHRTERHATAGKDTPAFVPSALPSGRAIDASANEMGNEPRGIDRTVKMYIGGKQVRPDGGNSYAVHGPGSAVGLAGLGNRKDIRNAVEAAAKAAGWGAATAHNRAQVLYYVAENLASRAPEFEARLRAMTGCTSDAAVDEVALAVRRTFWYAAWADKFDGAVHATRTNNVTLAMNEPWGVMGVACPDEAPLLAFVSLVMPAIAMGNRVIALPSPTHPLAATDLYTVFDTSDVPDGVVNIVTGERDVLAKTLAEHDEVAAMWYFGSRAGSTMVEKAAAGNLKSTWVNHGRSLAWNESDAQGRGFLRRATQVKNIWVPYGE
jgi:aldehyde dehydrogenase (NAD+)